MSIRLPHRPGTSALFALLTLLVQLITVPRAAGAELDVIKDYKWKHEDGVVAGLHRVMFTADGKTLLSAGYSCVRLWDVSSDTPKQRSARTQIGALGRHGIWDAAISADGRIVAVGGDKILYLYEVADGIFKERAIVKDQAGAVRALAFTADGKTLAAGSDDKTIRVYDLSGEKPRERIGFRPEKVGSSIHGLQFLGDDKSLLYAFKTGAANVAIADVGGKDAKTTASLADKDVLRAVLSPDGKLLALFSNFDVKLYDVSGGKFKAHAPLKGHTKQGMGLAFSPDGKLLASVAKDSKCIVWDVAAGQPLLTKVYAGDVEDAAFAPGTNSSGEYRLAVPTHQREIQMFHLKLK